MGDEPNRKGIRPPPYGRQMQDDCQRLRAQSRELHILAMLAQEEARDLQRRVALRRDRRPLPQGDPGGASALRGADAESRARRR